MARRPRADAIGVDYFNFGFNPWMLGIVTGAIAAALFTGRPWVAVGAVAVYVIVGCLQGRD